jgi:hypothetical protein
MREVRKTIIVAALAAAFLNVTARLPLDGACAWLASVVAQPAPATG